jgi:hypothetical protein
MIDFILLNAGILFISNLILYSYNRYNNMKSDNATIKQNNIFLRIIKSLQNQIVSSHNDTIYIIKSFQNERDSIYNENYNEIDNLLFHKIQLEKKYNNEIIDLQKKEEETHIKITIQNFIIKQLHDKLTTALKNNINLEEKISICQNNNINLEEQLIFLNSQLSVIEDTSNLQYNLDAYQNENIILQERLDALTASKKTTEQLLDEKIDICQIDETDNYCIITENDISFL